MNKKQKYISIVIILITIGIFLNRNIIFLNKITIDNLSIKTIVKGCETNIIGKEIAIGVNGNGFKTGDIVLVNGKEVDTVVVTDKYLTFLLEKDIYGNSDSLIISANRFTPKKNIVLKSNNKVIDVFFPKEVIDNELVIDEITPSIINLNKKNEDTAISILGKGFSKEEKVYINGEEQLTTFGNENLLTCVVSVSNYDNNNKKMNVMIKSYRDLNKSREIRISEERYLYLE